MMTRNANVLWCIIIVHYNKTWINQINIPMIGSAINLVICVISFWKSLTLNRDNDDDDDHDDYEDNDA